MIRNSWKVSVIRAWFRPIGPYTEITYLDRALYIVTPTRRLINVDKERKRGRL